MSIEPSVQDLFNLTGKKVLITGASGYLGSSMARGLAEAGATVIVGSRETARALDVAKGLPGNRNHCGVAIDHMSEASIRKGFNSAVEQVGTIDALVNNGHEAVNKDWTEVDAEQFTQLLGNATGFFLLARLLRDHAVKQKIPASIVMLGSMYGVVGSYPDAYQGIGSASPVGYHTLKGGIIHMTRHLAVYWAQDNVRVNCLSPGPFPNFPKVPSEMVKRLCKKSPMKRMGLPHELKGSLLLLVSEAGSYITGQNLLVDGGWTAW
ncbi:MAG: Dihydroanticapsin 7-dehydrogenase [Candidatus Moanabacter tarae]|uniref:Dihydroanticapsin 7-dehydrogenase n=1 Tax=Candidatus Moanibacter tarae TaxID=2200854 RepID=A0A2Z4AK79_9BACT|nr:MAG: Dihydroanticapsin 7-dehydrogenase [Candidatus Moanabacter tarae]|tara:strand:- start:28048 stop:28842 length:795 start_codon:yes stop_codon:yes gene_type:complete